MPPKQLVQLCQIPTNNIAHNDDLLSHASSLESVIDACNLDIKRIQQWINDNSDG